MEFTQPPSLHLLLDLTSCERHIQLSYDGHEYGLRAPPPEELDESGLVADHGPQEKLHVRLLEGPAAHVDHLLLNEAIKYLKT